MRRASEHASLFHERDGRRMHEAVKEGKSVAEPIEREVPEDDRRDEDDAFRDGLVFAGHGVLRGVSEEDHHQEITHADRARFAFEHEAQDREDAQIYDRPAQDDFGDRDRGHERGVPVDVEEGEGHGAVV